MFLFELKLRANSKFEVIILTGFIDTSVSHEYACRELAVDSNILSELQYALNIKRDMF